VFKAGGGAVFEPGADSAYINEAGDVGFSWGEAIFVDFPIGAGRARVTDAAGGLTIEKGFAGQGQLRE
jgi:hypothetical protein